MRLDTCYVICERLMSKHAMLKIIMNAKHILYSLVNSGYTRQLLYALILPVVPLSVVSFHFIRWLVTISTNSKHFSLYHLIFSFYIQMLSLCVANVWMFVVNSIISLFSFGIHISTFAVLVTVHVTTLKQLLSYVREKYLTVFNLSR